MKKLILFVAALTLGLTSCSSDDNSSDSSGGNSELKVTIDGVQKTFNTVVVNKQSYTEDGESWVEMSVTATIDNNPSEVISFYVEDQSVGSDAIWDFRYTKSGESYSHWSDQTNMTAIVQTNTNKKLKGTFEAVLSSGYDENGELIKVILSNGSFDISY